MEMKVKDKLPIGEKIKYQRKKLNMTQAALAEKLKVSPVNISQIETGQRSPTMDTIQAIANALDISIRDLVGPLAYDIGFKDGSEVEEFQNYVVDELWKREGYTHSDKEVQLINAFASLNETGQQKAVERVEELTEIPKYQRK